MRIQILFIFFIFLGTGNCLAQSFTESVEPSRLMINGASREGFMTSFEESASEIRKSWWKYSREFGRPLNMKTYYEVTIPSTENSGNVDIILLSRTSRRESGSTFFLAIKGDDLPQEKQQTYHEQVRLILLDFKKYQFVKKLELQIKQQEDQVKDLSKKVEDNPLQINVQELMSAQLELEELKSRLSQVYQ